MSRIARRTVFSLTMFGAGLFAAAMVHAQSVDPRIARLTDLVVQTVPMGEIFDGLAAANPAFPVQENPDAVSAGQLACLRHELSSPGYRRMKRADVVAYVDRHPGAVDADIAVLELGAARMMSRLMLAGVEEELTGVPVDEQAVMASAGEGELEAFMQMMTGPEHARLRGLLGIGDAYDAQRSAEENESAGEQAGGDLATKVMLTAMSSCDVSIDALFD